MLKRTLLFSNPASLTTRNEQLVVSEPGGGKEIATVPIEDVGYVVLENRQLYVSMPLYEKLIANNVAVVFCNNAHMPNGMLLNLDGNNLQSELFRHQVNSSVPLKKNLWKQTIEAKLKNQAMHLKKQSLRDGDIMSLSKNVLSGDSDNKEGSASRLYWKRLFGKNFTRERYGDYPNNYLNYGYAILRAAVARSLTGSGLLATLGIHHKNKYNAYCLADDIMEPYRPFVDECVFGMVEEGFEQELEKEGKARLLNLLSADVVFRDKKRPLMVGLSVTTASLAKCFSGQAKRITYGTVP
jgi:CRISPR-associated protein Cas1